MSLVIRGRPFASKAEQARLFATLLERIESCDNDEQLDFLLDGHADDFARFAACEALPEAVKNHHGFDWNEALQNAVTAKRRELETMKEYELWP